MDDPAATFRDLQQRRRRPRLSQAEIARAAGLLGDADIKLRFFVGDLLARQGKRGAEALLHQADSTHNEARRSALHVLGKIAQRLEKGGVYKRVTGRLRLGLRDEDAKVRKNCVVSLGKIGDPANTPDLADALKREDVDWVRTSLILALGATGGPEASRVLGAYGARDAAEEEALRQARDRIVDPNTAWHLRAEFEAPVEVALLTFDGMEHILARQVKNNAGLKAQAITPGVVTVHTARPLDLYALRPFRQLAVSLTARANDGTPLESQIPALIEEQGLFERLAAWHEGGAGAVRYRFEVRGPGLEHPRRRALVRAWVERLEKADTPLRNSASHYDIELRVDIGPEQLRLWACPGQAQDPRFVYRKQSLAASIEPSAAAALVAELPTGGPRVLDPFCGSGTLLAERGLARPATALVGFDVDARAVRSARQNLSAAGLLQANILQRDMRRAAKQGPFDEIISNMPFGIRVGNHAANEALYRDFFALMPALLRPGGVVGLYTQEIKLTRALFDASPNLELSRVRRVEVGGLMPAFFVGCAAVQA